MELRIVFRNNQIIINAKLRLKKFEDIQIIPQSIIFLFKFSMSKVIPEALAKVTIWDYILDVNLNDEIKIFIGKENTIFSDLSQEEIERILLKIIDNGAIICLEVIND